MKKINKKLKRINKTCSACPSQWEGELEDGKFIYVRYRWGNLGYGLGKTIGEAIENYDYGDDIGDNLDGVLKTDEMLKMLGLKIIK